MERTAQLSIVLAVLATATVAVLPTPAGLTTAGQYAIATMVFAAVLWVTGALPLPVTALLIPALLTIFGVYTDLGAAVVGFADPVIFLLLAGFMLAEAFTDHGIDRRVALGLLVRIGTSPKRLVLAVMIATALLSMAISNTATTAMMVPIAIGLVAQLGGTEGEEVTNLEVAMLLGTAYAASLGGVGTLVGTPPNAIVVGQLRELVGIRISFVEWLAIGLPMVVVTLPIAWLLLVTVYPPQRRDITAARESAKQDLEAAGKLGTGSRRAVAVFAAVAALWLLGGFGFAFRGVLPVEWFVTLFGGAGPTIFGLQGHQGLLYYVLVGLLAIPALVISGASEWDDLLDIDWGTLILLGGGISLANALSDTDATRWLADVAFAVFEGTPLPVVLLAIIALVVLIGELASNTAMAAMIAPLFINLGPVYASVIGTTESLAAVYLAVAGAIAASYGFALPVATPPNAIVFGAGRIRREHMLRAGILLDVIVVLLATTVITVMMRFVWPVVLG